MAKITKAADATRVVSETKVAENRVDEETKEIERSDDENPE